MKTRTLNNLFLVNLFSIFYVSFVESTACPANEYTSQTQKYKIEFEIDATWKYSDFAAYTQAPMLDRASSMLTKEELFDFLDNSGQTTFPVVGADEWTTVIDYENGDAPSYVRWYQVGTAGGSGYKSMSSWKTYSQGGSTGITALETNYNWLGYNFRWQATTCDGGGVSCHSKVVLLCQSCPAGTISPVGSISSDACVCQADRYQETRLFPPADARTTCFPVDNNGGLSRSCDVTGENYGNGAHAVQFSSQYSTAYSPHTMFNSEDVTYGNDAAFANGQYNSAGIFVGSGQLNSDYPGDYIAISMPTKVRVTRIEMYMQTYEYRDYTVFAKKYQVLGRNGVSESWQEIHEEMDAMNTLFYDPVKCTRGLDEGTDCMHKQEITTDYSFSQIAIVFETKQPSQWAYIALAELNIYGTSVETCTSCPAGMTSPAGSTSLDTCLCQSGSFKAPITLPGLNALYLFDSDTRDSSGNGYDLTMTNGAADPYSFLGANGVDPSLKIKDETTLLTRTATVASQNLLNNIVNGKPVGTLAVWVKDIRFVDGNDHQYGILGLNWADGKWFRLDVYASGKLVFVLYAGAWGTTSMFPECQNSPDWTRGGWWHIVFTSDGTNVGMQYRSAADASYTSCTLLSEQSGNPVISTWTATGSVSASSIETFKINAVNALNPGTLIDEVRVYNRVLSSEEILQVFDEKNNVCKSCGAGLTTLAPGAVSADACVCSVGSFKTDAYDTHLIAHYGFDGDTRDLQNPGNVATLTGNGGIASLDTTHKISGSHSVKLTNDDGLKTFVLLPQFELDTSLTISLWFRWDVTSLHDSGYTKLFYFSGDLKLYAAGDSSVSGDGEALSFVMYDQNNNRIEYKNSDRFYFSNNVWYHVSWVINKNSEMRIFIDGEYVPRTNTDKLESGKFPLWGASANMNNNRIGTHVSQDDGRDSIDGHVEEIRLYNTALPDSAVKALYEARGAPCMSCSSGLTTLAPGANSSDACACQAGSYSPFSDAVVAFNPANELFGSARSESLGSLDFNIASLGFTVVTKFNMKSASVVNHNRIFDFGGKDGVSVDKTKPNYNIILMRGGSSQDLYFSIWKSSGVWTGGCELIVPFQFDTWHQVSARYHPSDGVYLTIDDSPVVHDGSENCKNQPDRTLTTNLIADSWWSADSQSDIEIAGVYAFNRYLSDAEAQAVLDMIKVEGLDDPCANCPTDSPYTDPSHGATSADECQAPPASCDTITVTSDRKIIYEKTIHQDLGDADATWEGYMSWVSAHAGYTVPTVSQMNEFVETAEFADLKTASQIDPGGDHALTTDEWTPVYADDGITRKWYQIGYNSNQDSYPRGASIDFIYFVKTHNTGWYFATFFPSDVTNSMVKVVSFHNSPSPYTLTFSAATTADVLVVSGSNYRYTTNVQVAGEFTVTVGTETSVVTDAAGAVVATSAGGTEYPLPRWVLGAAGATCDDTCGNFDMNCDSLAQTAIRTQSDITPIIQDILGITCVYTGERNYAGTPFIHSTTDKCYAYTDTWTDTSRTQQTSSVCDANPYDLHRPLCRCVPETAGFDHAITGVLQSYSSPQVILRYKSEVCPTTDTDGPSCPAGSSLPPGSSSLDACACDANLHRDLSPIYDGRPPISAWSYSQLSSEAACNTPLHFGVHDGVDTSGTAGTGRTACFETVDSNNYLQLDMSTDCLLYTSPSPRDQRGSRMPSSA